MKHPPHKEASMTTRRHTTRGKGFALALLVVLSLIIAVAAGACGGKGKSSGGGAPPTLYPSTISPTPSASPSTPGKHPSPTATPSNGASPSSKPISDAAMRAGILRRLSQEPTLVGIQFTILVRQAVVRIYATVKTQDQRTTAQNIALSEPGIAKLISYIKVGGQTGY